MRGIISKSELVDDSKISSLESDSEEKFKYALFLFI